MQLVAWLSTQSRRRQLVLSFLLTLVISLVDLLTGAEIAFSIFYIIPIALVVWLIGKNPGIVLAITSAVLWLLADLLAGHAYSYPSIPLWNALVRLGFFLILTYALASLRAARKRQAELAAFVVHDLRSPLSITMTGLDTLRMLTDAGSDPVQSELINICMSSSERMLTLINSLLDLARLESGDMPLQQESVSVESLVETALKEVSLWARQKQVKLVSEANATTVYADTTLTMRVLVNLLTNALKFSPPDTTVSLSAAPDQDNKVVFRITDHGPGIPQEWATKVFDKFAQVDVHQAKIGSGLGLTFCQIAVEAQGGRIWVESKKGQGATFLFTLPASQIGDGQGEVEVN